MKKLILTFLLFGWLISPLFSQTGSILNFGVGIHVIEGDSIVAIPVGGTAPYTYLWNTGETTPYSVNDVFGYRCITVTDSEGATAQTCTVTPYNCAVQLVLVNDSLFPATTGYPPFTYVWHIDGTTTSTTKSIKYNTGHEYCLDITDDTGCERTQCVGFCPSHLVQLNDTTLINVQSATLEPLKTRWLNSEGAVIGWSDTLFADLNSLAPCGIFTIDSAVGTNCHFESLQYGGIFSSSIFLDTVSLTITAKTIGGLPPFSYLWNNGATTKEQSYLPQNQYCVTVTDGSGTTSVSCNGANSYFGDLFFYEQVELDNFFLNHPNITSIIGNVTINNWQDAITNIDGFSNIKSVTGNLYLGNCDNLNGLSNLEYVGGILSIKSTKETNLTDFSKLKTVKRKLFIYGNSLLTSLNGLSNLTEVGELDITSNPKLTSITTLNGLTSVGKSITIRNNPKLTSLSGLKNITSIPCGLYIKDNNTLANCELCALADFAGSFTIADNAPGCESFADITCGNVISGTVYYDFNQNQQQDDFEVGVANQKVWINNPGYFAITDEFGKYYHYATDGDYTLAWEANSNWQLSTSPSEYSITFVNGTPSIGNDFGIYPTTEIHELSTTITSGLPRCNDTVSFYLSVANDGTYQESGLVQLIYGDSEPIINYISAYPAPTTLNVANHTLTWNFDNLYPWDSKKIKIQFALPQQGIVNLSSTVYRDSLGIDVYANKTHLSTLIACSFDPNDKQVSPIGVNEEHLTLKNQSLAYTVRFQNTGNSYAKDVIIRDTLDANLNWSSFRVRNSSHKVQTSISPEGLVTFHFKNIYLVDSTEDFDASQGFITYTISPKENLPENTVISNTAHIYFDFNPVVITNTTINTLVTQLPVSIHQVLEPVTFTVYPNPATDKFQILIDKNNRKQVLVLEMTTLTGKTMALKPIDNQQVTTISADHFPKGMYFISLKDKETGAILNTKKLVIE